MLAHFPKAESSFLKPPMVCVAFRDTSYKWESTHWLSTSGQPFLGAQERNFSWTLFERLYSGFGENGLPDVTCEVELMEGLVLQLVNVSLRSEAPIVGL